MKNLILSVALIATLCLPALAQNGQGQNNNNQGRHVRGVPGPGAGLPVIAVGVGGFGVYWLIKRRPRKA